jgi:hypothetical protein
MAQDWYEQAITYGVELGWIDRPESAKRLNGLEEVRKKMPKEMQAIDADEKATIVAGHRAPRHHRPGREGNSRPQ